MASRHYFDQKVLCTVIMRISPVLLLLPVLVLTGSAAIANDDRPASPQPAIASPVPALLTIKSLAGTYRGVVNEKALKELSSNLKKWLSGTVEEQSAFQQTETAMRQLIEQMSITINADGTFEATVNNAKRRGTVKLAGNKLIFTTDSDKPGSDVNGSTNLSKCSECISTLYVSADGKTLLIDNPPKLSALLRGYVKQ